jgi:hypothetical protein
VSAKILEEAWKCQRLWSALADTLGLRIARWRLGNLALVVLGAVCGAFATQAWLDKPVSTVFGAVGAAALAAAAFVQGRLLGPERLRARLTARSASEALKSAVFRYLARVSPYDGDDAGRAATLDQALREVMNHGGELVADMRLAPARPQAVPAVAGVGDYVTLRAEGQRDYYLDRLWLHRRSERAWRRAEMAMTLVAALLAAVGGALGATSLAAWVAVATTLAATVGSHLAGAQHARLAALYAQTVGELDRLLAGFDATTATGDDAAAFVDRVEALLVRQNEEWVSSLVPQP